MPGEMSTTGPENERAV